MRKRHKTSTTPALRKYPARKVMHWEAITHLAVLLELALSLFPAYASYSPEEEERNCGSVSSVAQATSASLINRLDGLARQYYGIEYFLLTPDQMVEVAKRFGSNHYQGLPTGISETSEKNRKRCDQYRSWQAMYKKSFAPLESLRATGGFFFQQWGFEDIKGIASICPGYTVGAEDSDNGCNSRTTSSPLRDISKGCRTQAAGKWILDQIPALLTALQTPDSLAKEFGMSPILINSHMDMSSMCLKLVTFPLANLSFPEFTVKKSAGSQSLQSSALKASVDCYNTPTASTCGLAARQTNLLGVGAANTGERTCYTYSQIARIIWSVASQSDYSYTLTTYPEASRLRNEARIALRYMRVNCKRI